MIVLLFLGDVYYMNGMCFTMLTRSIVLMLFSTTKSWLFKLRFTL